MNIQEEKKILIRHLELMQGLTTYLIMDNYVVESKPDLKEKASNIHKLIAELKNSI